MPSSPAAPESPFFPDPQHWVRPGTSADAALLDGWLASIQPLPVPESRARRMALQALLAQNGQGLCLLAGHGLPDADGTVSVRVLLPVTLIHSLSLGGRAALAAEWWCESVGPARHAWLVACVEMLADWCRAHGIRHVLLAPEVAADGIPPDGFRIDAAGFWHCRLLPSAKVLG